jgi:glycosyltransferase involved in cell wall biosynthesis
MKPVIVTTSWDDGHKCDIRLASLLRKYGVRATFYVCPETHEFSASERLAPDEIRALAAEFEIGAHTMTHPFLSRLDTDAARQDIVRSKETLEAIVGQPVRSFCYPYGDHNEETKRIVCEAGFDRARSINRFVTRSADRFAIGTSVDTYDHLRDGMLSILRMCRRRPWQIFRMRRWDNLAKVMFELARERGEVFHLWGHSREIDIHRDWERLEVFLAWLSEQPDVVFASNAEVPLSAPRALITAPYFKPNSGGLEEYAYQIASGLQDRRGWQVTVATSGRKAEAGTGDFQGVRVHRLPYWLTLSNTPLGFRWRRRLRQVIAAERPDVIITHAPVPGMIDLTAGLVGKIPFVVTYHYGSMLKGNRLTDPVIRLYEGFLLPRALRKARGLILTSTFVQHTALLRQYAGKSIVIRPGVDVSFYPPRPIRQAGHTLMHVGGLKQGERHKDLLTSLRVTTELRNTYPNVRLIVVGNGNQQKYFERQAHQLGITGNVEFRGWLGGQDLLAAYHDADVLITPSRVEAFGMVLIEAMASGLPVVASRVGGIPEVVTDGETGFLLEPGDVAGFTLKISMLFDNAELRERFSRNGLRAAMVQDWSAQVERTAGFVENVI